MLSTDKQELLALTIPFGTNVTTEQLAYRDKIKNQQQKLKKLNSQKIQRTSKIEASNIIEFLKMHGVERVGFCETQPKYYYHGHSIPYAHQYGIVFAVPMNYERMKVAPSLESATEIMKIYSGVGEVVVSLTQWMQENGIDAMGHHPMGDQNEFHHLLLPPHGYYAGLGEQGRTGLFIDHELGPLVRLGMVTTSLELPVNGPIDRGVNAFCQRCKYCISFCPPRAIPDTNNVFLDNQRKEFTIDGDKCIKYFEKHYGCGKCMVYCVLAKPNKMEIGKRMDRVEQWYQRWVVSGELIALNESHNQI